MEDLALHSAPLASRTCISSHEQQEGKRVRYEGALLQPVEIAVPFIVWHIQQRRSLPRRLLVSKTHQPARQSEHDICIAHRRQCACFSLSVQPTVRLFASPAGTPFAFVRHTESPSRPSFSEALRGFAPHRHRTTRRHEYHCQPLQNCSCASLCLGDRRAALGRSCSTASSRSLLRRLLPPAPIPQHARTHTHRVPCRI